MVAFGDVRDGRTRTWMTVSMRHVVEFLQRYLREHWDVLRHTQIRDTAFGVLALIEKWGAHKKIEPLAAAQMRRRNHGSVRMRRDA